MKRASIFQSIKFTFFGAFVFARIISSSHALAQAIVTGKDPDELPKPTKFAMPFAFYSESTRFAAGVGGIVSGMGQPQLSAGLAVFGSTNGSVGLYFINDDLRIGNDSRFFIDSKIGATRYGKIDEYVDGNIQFPGEAGDNESNADDFVQSESVNVFGEINLKYVLPIGDAKNDLIARYSVDHGMLAAGASGGHSWNPLESGRTFAEITPFWNYRHITPLQRINNLQEDDYNTDGLRLTLRWDNTDFPVNPSRGNVARIDLVRDFGVLNSSGAYTTIEGSYTQYVPLGSNEWFKQQTLALNIWAIDEISGDAPYYTGATLGGFSTMRGYPFGRFSGTSAITTSAELRLMPNWNPLNEFKEINRIARVQWVQLALFGELGRAGDSFSVDELLQDMRWDAGVGIRMLAYGVVLRADLAYCEEGTTLWLMVGQTF